MFGTKSTHEVVIGLLYFNKHDGNGDVDQVELDYSRHYHGGALSMEQGGRRGSAGSSGTTTPWARPCLRLERRSGASRLLCSGRAGLLVQRIDRVGQFAVRYHAGRHIYCHRSREIMTKSRRT